MAGKRVEIKDENLDLVSGGSFDLDTKQGLCGINGDLSWSFSNLSEVLRVKNEVVNGGGYTSIAQRDQMIIDALKGANLITSVASSN